MTEFFIGVDGGGSGCRAAIANASGVVLGEGRSGAANIFTDVENSVSHIGEAAARACQAAGIDTSVLSKSCAVLGLAGANLGQTVSDVRSRLPFGTCTIGTDAWVAAHGALGARDGAIAVLGTGSVFARKSGNEVHTVGGWGFFIGDQGAGATLGQALLSEAMLAHDRVRPGSKLTARVLAEFDNDPVALAAFAKTAVPGDFAGYAPWIFEAAGAGDPVAVRLLAAAAAQVDEAIRVVLSGSDRLCLLGGLGRFYEDWLADEHRRCVVAAQGDALAGATHLAVQRYGRDPVTHG